MLFILYLKMAHLDLFYNALLNRDVQNHEFYYKQDF